MYLSESKRETFLSMYPGVSTSRERFLSMYSGETPIPTYPDGFPFGVKQPTRTRETVCCCAFNDEDLYTQHLITLLKKHSIDSRVSIEAGYKEGVEHTKTFTFFASHKMRSSCIYSDCVQYEAQIHIRIHCFFDMLEELLLEREAITISKVMVTSKTEAPHNERTTSLTLFVSS